MLTGKVTVTRLFNLASKLVSAFPRSASLKLHKLSRGKLNLYADARRTLRAGEDYRKVRPNPLNTSPRMACACDGLSGSDGVQSLIYKKEIYSPALKNSRSK
ncbi:hypothetical protein EVAR_46652_1 [Eumeta japonica]|uniref:Uncharacterized protein n=1 Tax=Eumeta variegata TaxID=151549 RepID=A0A4C1WGR3_EUMVA|nr:hypothetical protein EVAR_46652_1 [Eumeta japonica]